MNYPESIIQADIFRALCKMRIYSFMVPNDAAGKISLNRAMRLKAMGLRSGVSDMIMVLKNKIIFLEVKTETGVQSKHQKIFQNKIKSLGHEYYIVRSIDDVLKIIKENTK